MPVWVDLYDVAYIDTNIDYARWNIYKPVWLCMFIILYLCKKIFFK